MKLSRHNVGVIVDNWLYIEGGEMYEVGASSRNDTRYRTCFAIQNSTFLDILHNGDSIMNLDDRLS